MDSQCGVQQQRQSPGFETIQNAYLASQGHGNFWYNQGNSSVRVHENMAFLQAGSGEDRAFAVVQPQTQHHYIDREVVVETSKPYKKSRRTWCIVLLVLVIVVIIAAVAIGIGIHEANKSSGY